MSSTERIGLLAPTDLDVSVVLPEGLMRIAAQGLTDLSPWHLMPRDLAKKCMAGLRSKYRSKYVPFARRQDNDDLACIAPDETGRVIIVHNFASDGAERVATYETFWDWFRAAIDDMIAFEP